MIRPRGKDAIEIQMPGASTKQNPEIIDVIKKPARLEFRAVHDTLDPYTTALKDYPVGYEVLAEEREDRMTGEITERRIFVKRIPEATGEIVEDAFAAQSTTGSFEVNLVMTGEGSKILRAVTEKMVGKPLAIVLDGKLYSAPVVNSVLSRNAQITGGFSQREAFDLANGSSISCCIFRCISGIKEEQFR